MTLLYPRSCEQVRAGHPDKLCDRIADSILDKLLEGNRAARPATSTGSFPSIRAGLEVLAKSETVVLSGEIRADVADPHLDYERIVREVFFSVGYPNSEAIEVVNLIGQQQPELQASSDRLGAGDQGIMIGYATSETAESMPFDFVVATRICRELDDRMGANGFDWLRPDGKAQVTLDESGVIRKIVIGAQHARVVHGTSSPVKIQEIVKEQIIEELLYPMLGRSVVREAAVIVNGSGSFANGGPAGDAGVVGRKIVCDAYGPSVPVGGGAFSGKDPTKVDRSGAYMARHVAKTALAQGVKEGMRAVTSRIAYAIGSVQPEMIFVSTDDGTDITGWAMAEFDDFSPAGVAERFDLWKGSSSSWRYADTACYGHFGRSEFPWEW